MKSDSTPEPEKKPAEEVDSAGCAPTSGSEVFATTLRNISGMIITIEKGTRVRVTHQQEEDGRCTIHLTEKDNPTRIWNTICGVPMKHLQFDPQNARAMTPATEQDHEK